MTQIGTVGIRTQSHGIVDVPLYDAESVGMTEDGTVNDSVYSMLRVRTANGVGFIPLVDPSEASHPYLRVRTQNHGILAVHNQSVLYDIIDSCETGSISDKYYGYVGRWTYTTGGPTSPIDGNYYAINKQSISATDSDAIYGDTGTGLPYDFPFGNELAAWIWIGSASIVDLMFGVDDTNDGYYAIRIDLEDPDEGFVLFRDCGTENDISGGTSASVTAGGWFDVHVAWDNNGVSHWINDESGERVFTSGYTPAGKYETHSGIGIRATASSYEVGFDKIRVIK